MKVDEAFIRESVLDSRAKVHEGYKPIMPGFKGQLNEEELLKLIVCLKALKPGELPKPVEDAPPPARAGRPK